MTTGTRFIHYIISAFIVSTLRQLSCCCAVGSDGSRGPEKVLVDHTELMKVVDASSLGDYRVSPDLRYCAVPAESSSSGYSIIVMDITKPTHEIHTVLHNATRAEWAHDSRTLYYTKLNESWMPASVWRVDVEAESEASEMVYSEDDPSFLVDVTKTKVPWLPCGLIVSSSSRSG